MGCMIRAHGVRAACDWLPHQISWVQGSLWLAGSSDPVESRQPVMGCMIRAHGVRAACDWLPHQIPWCQGSLWLAGSSDPMVSGQPVIGWLIWSNGVRAACDWLYDQSPWCQGSLWLLTGIHSEVTLVPVGLVPTKLSIQAEHCNREKCRSTGPPEVHFHSIGRPVCLGPDVQDKCLI